MPVPTTRSEARAEWRRPRLFRLDRATDVRGGMTGAGGGTDAEIGGAGTSTANKLLVNTAETSSYNTPTTPYAGPGLAAPS